MSLYLTSVGQGKPLVLFHGWGFDSQIWSSLLPDLQATYKVFTVDLPGFGFSSLLDWTHFKEELLVQLPNQFALAGWSMGGLYATRLALEAPGSVLSLVNIASSPRFIADADWPGLDRKVIQSFQHKLSRDPQQTLKDFVALQTKGSVLASETKQIPSQDSLRQGLEILNSWDLRSSLQRLSIPVSYLFGRFDSIISIKTMQVLEKLCPHVQCRVFTQSAHIPFLSHKSEFLSELNEVLK